MKDPTLILENALAKSGHDYPAANSLYNALWYLRTGEYPEQSLYRGQKRGLAHAMRPYELVDQDGEIPSEDYDTLNGALRAARLHMLESYAIWHGEVCVSRAEGYRGADDRARQGMGEPTLDPSGMRAS